MKLLFIYRKIVLNKYDSITIKVISYILLPNLITIIWSSRYQAKLQNM